MNNPSSGLAFRVGLLIVTAAILLVGLYVFFRGTIRRNNSYHLILITQDAQGISTQDKVYLAGVQIGEVSGVALGNGGREALITLVIKKGFQIPVGSIFLITSSLLSGEADVNIVPPPQTVDESNPDSFIKPNTVIHGEEGLGPTSLAADASNVLRQFDKTTNTANTLLQQLNVTVGAINKVVGSPTTQESLIDTVKNINLASEQGLALTKELRSDLAADNVEVASTLHNVSVASASVNDVATGNKKQLVEIIDNLNKATQQVAELSQSANSTMTRGNTIQNLSDTAANLKEATIKLNTIESDIEGLTGDKDVQAELRQTLKNTAVASDNTRILVSRLTALTGSRPTVFKKGDLKFVSRLDFTQNLRTNLFRTDFNVYAPFSNSTFAQLGVYDLTGGNKLNLEYGQTNPLNKFITYRAGLYAGQVGVGADYDLFGDHDFSLDVYDPNHLRADFRQKIPLRNQSALYLGLENFPRTNAVSVGFQLQR